MIKRKDLIFDILNGDNIARQQFIKANEIWIEEIVERYVMRSNLPISVLRREVHSALMNGITFHRNMDIEIIVHSYMEQLILEHN